MNGDFCLGLYTAAYNSTAVQAFAASPHASGLSAQSCSPYAIVQICTKEKFSESAVAVNKLYLNYWSVWVV